MFEEYVKHTLESYAGYNIEQDKLLSCASGGVATALAEQWIANGGYVAGVRYSDDFRRAEYVLIKSKHEINQLKGSKYIDAELNDIFVKVKHALEEGKKVLFFGLPCRVGGLKFFIGDNDNLVTCELICHGPTYNKVHEDYLNYLEKKYKSKIIDFSVRKKKHRWLPFYAYAKFENGKEFFELYYQSKYNIAFSYLPLRKCFNCGFKGNNRVGDLQIGDFWGFDKKESYYNECGVSCILVHTEKGLIFLKNSKNLKIFKVKTETILKGNSSIYTIREKKDNYELMLKLLNERGLLCATRKGFTRKQKIDHFLYNLLRPIKKIRRILLKKK